MKPILILSFVLASLVSNGQGGYQIADTTKLWNTLHTGSGFWTVVNAASTTTTKFIDQTPGDQYLNVLECGDSLLQEWNGIGLIREDTINKRVYYRGGDNIDGLIYDFSLEVGDTVTVHNENFYSYGEVSFVIDSVDTVNLNNVLRKRLFLFSQDNISESYYPDEIWIEGIGSNYGIMYSGFGAYGLAGGAVQLLCASQNGNNIFMDSLFDKCYYDTFYPHIVQDFFDTAYLNTYYEFQIQIDTGDAVNFSLHGEVVPEGFTFDSISGVLSGTPTQVGILYCLILAENLDLGFYTDVIYNDLIVVLPTQAEQFNTKENFKIYPNPVSDVLHIDVANAGSNGNYLEIYSSSGQLVHKIDFNGSDRLDLTSLKSGLYLVKIFNSEGSLLYTEQIIKGN